MDRALYFILVLVTGVIGIPPTTTSILTVLLGNDPLGSNGGRVDIGLGGKANDSNPITQTKDTPGNILNMTLSSQNGILPSDTTVASSISDGNLMDNATSGSTTQVYSLTTDIAPESSTSSDILAFKSTLSPSTPDYAITSVIALQSSNSDDIPKQESTLPTLTSAGVPLSEQTVDYSTFNAISMNTESHSPPSGNSVTDTKTQTSVSIDIRTADYASTTPRYTPTPGGVTAGDNLTPASVPSEITGETSLYDSVTDTLISLSPVPSHATAGMSITNDTLTTDSPIVTSAGTEVTTNNITLIVNSTQKEIVMSIVTTGGYSIDQGTYAPISGTSAPSSGTSAPSSGASAPSSGTSAPSSGTYAPISGTSAPSSGTSAPSSGTSAPSSGAPAPNFGTAKTTSRTPTPVTPTVSKTETPPQITGTIGDSAFSLETDAPELSESTYVPDLGTTSHSSAYIPVDNDTLNPTNTSSYLETTIRYLVNGNTTSADIATTIIASSYDVTSARHSSLEITNLGTSATEGNRNGVDDVTADDVTRTGDTTLGSDVTTDYVSGFDYVQYTRIVSTVTGSLENKPNADDCTGGHSVILMNVNDIDAIFLKTKVDKILSPFCSRFLNKTSTSASCCICPSRIEKKMQNELNRMIHFVNRSDISIGQTKSPVVPEEIKNSSLPRYALYLLVIGGASVAMVTMAIISTALYKRYVRSKRRAELLRANVFYSNNTGQSNNQNYPRNPLYPIDESLPTKPMYVNNGSNLNQASYDTVIPDVSYPNV